MDSLMLRKLSILFVFSFLSMYGFYVAVLFSQLEEIYQYMLTTPLYVIGIISFIVGSIGALLPLKRTSSMFLFSVCTAFVLTSVMIYISE